MEWENLMNLFLNPAFVPTDELEVEIVYIDLVLFNAGSQWLSFTPSLQEFQQTIDSQYYHQDKK